MKTIVEFERALNETLSEINESGIRGLSLSEKSKKFFAIYKSIFKNISIDVFEEWANSISSKQKIDSICSLPEIELIVECILSFDYIVIHDVDQRLNYLSILKEKDLLQHIDNNMLFCNDMLRLAVSSFSLEVVQFIVENMKVEAIDVLDYTLSLFPFLYENSLPGLNSIESSVNDKVIQVKLSNILKYLITKVDIKTASKDIRERIRDIYKKYLIEIDTSYIANFNDFSKIFWLGVAASQNNVKKINIIIKAGVDIRAIQDDRKPALYYAVCEGNVKAAEILLQTEEDKNIIYNNAKDLIEFAVNQENPLKLFYILKELDISIKTPKEKNNTMLDYAVIFNSLKIVDYLIKNGADIEAGLLEGTTPLCYAVKNSNLAIVKYLVKNGANVKARDRYQKSLLSYATELNNIEVMEILINAGADVNERDNLTRPLFYSLHIKSCIFLLDNGADVTIEWPSIKIFRNLVNQYQFSFLSLREVIDKIDQLNCTNTKGINEDKIIAEMLVYKRSTCKQAINIENLAKMIEAISFNYKKNTRLVSKFINKEVSFYCIEMLMYSMVRISMDYKLAESEFILQEKGYIEDISLIVSQRIEKELKALKKLIYFFMENSYVQKASLANFPTIKLFQDRITQDDKNFILKYLNNEKDYKIFSNIDLEGCNISSKVNDKECNKSQSNGWFSFLIPYAHLRLLPNLLFLKTISLKDKMNGHSSFKNNIDHIPGKANIELYQHQKGDLGKG